MIELGELERRYAEFDRRNWRVVVVSLEGPEEARQTQTDFRHLLVVTDQEHRLSDATGVVHANSGPGGSDTSAPTTILIDKDGMVRWLYRPPSAVSRLSPDEVLQAIDGVSHPAE